MRHNERPNTVSVTLLEDRYFPGAFLTPAWELLRVTGARGEEVQVSPRSARALERSGAAIRVNTAKMGTAQRRLLLTIYGLTLVEEALPILLLRPRYQGTRIPWSTARVTNRDDPAARSAVSQALSALERRGLVLRYPIGSNRTQEVELTQAGRRVAKELEAARARRRAVTGNPKQES